MIDARMTVSTEDVKTPRASIIGVWPNSPAELNFY
jgi:hypothetical protein